MAGQCSVHFTSQGAPVIGAPLLKLVSSYRIFAFNTKIFLVTQPGNFALTKAGYTATFLVVLLASTNNLYMTNILPLFIIDWTASTINGENDWCACCRFWKISDVGQIPMKRIIILHLSCGNVFLRQRPSWRLPAGIHLWYSLLGIWTWCKIGSAVICSVNASRVKQIAILIMVEIWSLPRYLQRRCREMLMYGLPAVY